MQKRLVLDSNPTAEGIFSLKQGIKYLAGRGPICDISLPDIGASREHFSIACLGDSAEIIDLESRNGTRVNGEKITRHLLQHNDIIEVGTMSIRYEQGEDLKEINRIGETVSMLADDFMEHTTNIKHRYTHESWGNIRETESIIKRGDKDILSMMCSFSGELFSAKNINSVLEVALDAALDLTGSLRGSALLINEGEVEPKPVVVRFHDSIDRHDFPVSSSIVKDTIMSGESVVTSNAMLDSRFQTQDSVAIKRIASVMCVPLMTLEEKVLGALYIDNAEMVGEFSEKSLEIFAAIGHQSAVAVERVMLVESLQRVFFGSILTLTASLEAKDSYTKGHSERVTYYALLIADELGLVDEERNIVELAGVLHDVGKMSVPENVLVSEGRLSEEDFASIKEHPAKGADIILHMPEVVGIASIKKVAESVKWHHEKVDGTGYPDGLSNEQIPFVSRILAVADTFDALTSDRSYRKGKSMDAALRIMNACVQTQLDETVFRAFERVCDLGKIQEPHKMKSHLNFSMRILQESTAFAESDEAINDNYNIGVMNG